MTSCLEPLTEVTFTPDRTRTLLAAACGPVGLNPDGAILLRHHTNAVYRLTSAPVVVKIARPTIRHTRTVIQLARWLTTHGIPTVRLFDIDQPRSVAGCDITMWHYLPQNRAITADAIADPLAALHTARPPALPLPVFDPITGIRRSLRANRVLSRAELELASQRCSALASRLSTVQYELPPALIHADAQHRNTLWDQCAGTAVLSDWDSARIGPPEWDLVTVEIHCRRFEYPTDEYRSFCSRYGLDVRDWSGYGVLRDIRELTMIATNARKSAPNSPQAAEVRKRLHYLDDVPQRSWAIL